MKRILIIDDSPLIRRTLRSVLEHESDWAVCGEAENGREGIDKAKLLRPDLIVIDLVMPVLNGIEASRVLSRVLPATPLLMFSTFTDPHLEREALAVGVHAVVDKSKGAEILIRTIQKLFAPHENIPPPQTA